MENKKRYKVCGYDKDSSVYETYLVTNALEDALELARNLMRLVKEDCLCRSCSDGTREPIDWIEVFDLQNDSICFASYEAEKAEKLKRAVMDAGVNAVEGFLGFKLNDTINNLDDEMDNVIAQMPDEEYSKFLVFYGI